ncbi:helix-turn-helix domain-containing protein [Synechococcus sp. FACHB-909]|uniref:helix-turn-helix domain-containing protein n=1 Tax=Synechococcus sp. FACHB-909 TaxID=2692863 RepID=UPI0016879FE1|nr:helix-turn-helix domain-containing protein [Synechococcus sp. FACHB-909]MBD2718015.1 helix-turn-helix domain-containing protein [Synechococcus sp. FACHB-909]
MAGLQPRQLLDAPGLRTVLHTRAFGQWDSLVASTLGHHRSRLLPGSPPFEAQIRCGAVEEFQVLLLSGRGRLELQREQCGHGVLWIPLRGLTQEWINGVERVAEPGMALLFRPGDAMRGRTSDAITGLSILIPEPFLRGAAPPSPLLDQGHASRQLIAAGLQLARAAAWEPGGSQHAAAALEEALHQWCHPPDSDQGPERITARRRRQAVADARDWIQEHLTHRFRIEELSRAMGLSVRNLQYGFQEELGRSPMAEAKRLRLCRLRQLLLEADQDHRSIAELMQAAGLLACGGTAADYRRRWGESPRGTRRRRTMET